MRHWSRINMNLFNWMLMFMRLDITMPVEVLQLFLFMVRQCHLPPPPFDFIQYYWWEMWITATCNMRYIAIKFEAGNWLDLNLYLLTYISIAIIFTWMNKIILNWIHIWKMLFQWFMLCRTLFLLFLSFTCYYFYHY